MRSRNLRYTLPVMLLRLRSMARTIAPLLFLLAATTVSCDSRKEQPKLASYLPPETSAVLQVDSSLVDLLGLLPSNSFFFMPYLGGNTYESVTFLLLGEKKEGGQVATLLLEPNGTASIDRMALGEQVAFDDDGGQGYNSHLQWMVPDGKAGRYWIYLSEASSATAHQEVLRDDDGAGNLDSHLYWITQQEGDYWITLSSAGSEENNFVTTTLTGIVGPDSVNARADITHFEAWGPFRLQADDEISVSTSSTSGDPMLRLLFLPSDVGTLDGIIGDSTHSVDNLYEPASQPFGPFDLEEGDRIDITTNVAFDAFLEVKADPLLRNSRFPDFSEIEPSTCYIVDCWDTDLVNGTYSVSPLGEGWIGVQPSKEVIVGAEPPFKMAKFFPQLEDYKRKSPLLKRLTALPDWSSPIVGAIILSPHYLERLNRIDSQYIRDTDRWAINLLTKGFSFHATEQNGIVSAEVFVLTEDSNNRYSGVKEILEDIQRRFVNDFNQPLGIRNLINTIRFDRVNLRSYSLINRSEKTGLGNYHDGYDNTITH